ncbi:hypothetical protein HDU88_001330 [Geranomyces variabilis]|nr:hypothetical protein HDU88_001330 [Geranomyces variabilis]
MRPLDSLYSILARSPAEATAVPPKPSGRPSARALALAAGATTLALGTYLLLVDGRVVPALKHALPDRLGLSDSPPPPPQPPQSVKPDGIRALTGHTVHFIGDSVTRYQFIQLQYNWETKNVPTDLQPSTLIENKYDPTFQPLWPNWEHYYRATTDFIAAPSSHGFCDCRRTPEWHPTEHIENRYYDRHDSVDDTGTINPAVNSVATTKTTTKTTKIRFHQYFKDVGVCSLRGRRLGPKDGVRLDKPGDELPDWCATLASFIKGLLVDNWDEGHGGASSGSGLQSGRSETATSVPAAAAVAALPAPLTIVLNCGLHEPLKNETFNAIVDMFVRLSSDAATTVTTATTPTDASQQPPPPPLLIWKTTTPKRSGGPDPDASLRVPTDLPNVRVLDTGRVLREKFGEASGQHYRDDNHFTADVYQAFNEELARIAYDYHNEQEDVREKSAKT